VTFSGVMEYNIIICSLTTCRVTAGNDLTTFPQLSLCLKAVSSTSMPGAALNVYSSRPTRQDLLLFGPASQLRRLPSHNNSINLNQCQCVVKPVTVVRDLSVWFDAELAYQCARSFLGWRRHALPYAPNTCRSTTAQPRCHSKTSYN